jgi:uncharacterized membrane protein
MSFRDFALRLARWLIQPPDWSHFSAVLAIVALGVGMVAFAVLGMSQSVVAGLFVVGVFVLVVALLVLLWPIIMRWSRRWIEREEARKEEEDAQARQRARQAAEEARRRYQEETAKREVTDPADEVADFKQKRAQDKQRQEEAIKRIGELKKAALLLDLDFSERDPHEYVLENCELRRDSIMPICSSSLEDLAKLPAFKDLGEDAIVDLRRQRIEEKRILDRRIDLLRSMRDLFQEAGMVDLWYHPTMPSADPPHSKASEQSPPPSRECSPSASDGTK